MYTRPSPVGAASRAGQKIVRRVTKAQQPHAVWVRGRVAISKNVVRSFHPCAVEGLEGKTMLSGVTLIVHGQPVDSQAPAWVSSMAVAPAVANGESAAAHVPWTRTSWYSMTIES